MRPDIFPWTRGYSPASRSVDKWWGVPHRQRRVMSAGRAVWVKIRSSEAERAAWHAKARSAGLTLSDLVSPLGWAGAHRGPWRTPRSSVSAPASWRVSATTSTRSLAGPTRTCPCGSVVII